MGDDFLSLIVKIMDKFLFIYSSCSIRHELAHLNNFGVVLFLI